MASPHAQPAGLRELKGSRTRPRHKDRTPDATTPDALPQVDVGIASPTPLEAGELKYWNYFAPLLAKAKMLTPADMQTLVDYCRTCYWAEVANKRLRTAWNRRGKRFDRQYIRQLDVQLRGWIERKTTLANFLGLTAISRVKTSWTGFDQAPSAKTRPQSKVAELQERSRALRRPLAVGEKESQS